MKPLKVQDLPRKFQVTGVPSDSPITCRGVVDFGMKFEGEYTRILRFRALVVPQWEGDVMLSWNALDSLGINFMRDEETN